MVCLWNHCSGWTLFSSPFFSPMAVVDQTSCRLMQWTSPKSLAKNVLRWDITSIHHLVAFRNLFKCELMQQRCIRVGKAGNCLIAYIFTRGGGWHLNLNFTSLLLFMCMHHWRCTDGWCAFTSSHYPKIRAAILQILRHSLCRSSQGMDSL